MILYRQNIFTICFLICIITSLNAQSTNIDSIINIRKSQDIKNREYWESTVEMANYYVYKDLKKAEETIESVFSKYLDQGNQFDKCYHRHHLLRSWINHGNNRLSQAITHLNKAEKIVGSCGKRKDEIEIQINKASLLIGMKDSTARSYVEGYMTQIDTTLDRDEKIAWIMGNKYLGDLEEARGFFRTALGHYLVVLKSGVLNEIPDYRFGIIKGIARTATETGDYNYAIETLDSLIGDKDLFTYQQNNIRIALAINYYKKGEVIRAYDLTSEILSSDNVTTQDKIETCWIRTKIHLHDDDKERVYAELNKLEILRKDIQDGRLIARINLLQAEVSSIYNSFTKTNSLIDKYIKQGAGSKEQNLKAESLWLNSNISGNTGERLKVYLQSLNTANDKSSEAQLQEMMAIHKVEQEKQEKQLLKQKLVSEKKTSSQRMLAIFLLGFSAVLASLLWLMSRRKTRLQEQLNQLIKKEKERIKEERDKLAVDNEELVFKNHELLEINQSLLNRRNSEVETQDFKIEIATIDKIHLVLLSKVMYFKAEMEGTRVLLVDEKSLWTNSPVKNFVYKYKDNGIVLIFRGVAINANHIDWVNTSTVKMDNGEELKVGRTYKQDVIDMIEKRNNS